MGQPLERIAKQYEIVAKIREGGMGEIYKVRHRLLDELRVVKVLHSRYVSDAKLSARFAQEARAAIQLRHPNIVQIFDFTLDDTGAGLIVMEYIRGADLKQLITGGRPPSIGLVLEIARQSLRALGFLHRHGFVHRDVSPDNLMLTQDVDGRPLVKLIDLGIAKRLDSAHQLTTSGMFLGKYRYASPEHFGDGGVEGVEARSDLYTFGLVLYELVTGRYPLPGEGTAQLVAGHLYRQPLGFAETDPEGRIPEVFRRALLRSLAKAPDKRFADARDLIAEIVALQAAHPVDESCCDEARKLVSSELGEGRWQRPGSTGERLNRELDGVPAAEAPPTGGGATAASAAERQAELERQQAEEVAEIVAGVEEMLERGAVMEADRVLFQATETYGPRAALAAVRDRLDDLHRAKAKRRVEKLVRRAGIAFESRRFDEAAADLRRALETIPDDPWIRGRLAEAEEQQRRVEERRKRRREAGSYLVQAEEAEKRRDILKARLFVAQALQVDPENPIARARAMELDRRPIEPVLSPEAERHLDEIRELRRSGETLAAWRSVQAAVEEYGDEPFKTLQKEIADELLDGSGPKISR